MKIAYGNSRMETHWKNKDVSWDDFCTRVSTTQRTTESVEEYKKASKAEQANIKDVGGFVGGHLKGGSRKSGNVLCRSMLTLDMDYGEPGIVDEIEMLQDFACCIYSTHKHTPDNPRLRLIIPLLREVTEEEYPAVGRMVAKDIGIDLFDDTTYQPHRLMYWPSTSSNGEYVYKKIDGELLNPDEYLIRYDDWHDISTYPVSSRQSVAVSKSVKEQADPLQKEGVVGAFCRAYSISEAIEKFLPDVYAPSAMEGRYDYIQADSSAGVCLYEDKFAYSHHATDPACEKMMNAFDMVRIHKFGDMDDKKSFTAMAEFAVKDEKVNKLLLIEKQQEASFDFEEDADWTAMLQRDKNGNLYNNLYNIRLIMENDVQLKGIVFNQLADGMEIKGEVPWKHPARFWRDADDAQLICYVDAHYGTFSARNYQIGVQKVSDDRSYHPIKEYFEGLPEWDGVVRAERVLIDYLGAADNEYVRAVTRKTLCAAVDRVFHPGKKFDNMTVLNGAQGIGKSTLIARLGGDWYSDSLNISDMNDKTAAEKLQGYWILEIGELAGMKKADIDKVKAFISRQDDKYRASFGRRVTPHPRQCVFFGTTNSENGYLRDITGNRRFWNVKVPGGSDLKPWDLTQEVVDQIWAEVLCLVKKGEKLYLDADVEAMARIEQNAAMEQDEREGFVREYLDMLLPTNWDSLDIYKRQDYVRDTGDVTRPAGTVQREYVSNLEIWCECFGKRKEDIKPSDSYAIAAIMQRIETWEKTGGTKTSPIYGKQRVYRRR